MVLPAYSGQIQESKILFDGEACVPYVSRCVYALIDRWISGLRDKALATPKAAVVAMFIERPRRMRISSLPGHARALPVCIAEYRSSSAGESCAPHPRHPIHILRSQYYLVE